MIKKTLLLFFLFGIFSTAYSQNLVLRHGKMTNFLRSLKNNVQLPNGEFKEKKIVKLDKKVPEWIEHIASEIQVGVFGDKIINVAFCKAKSGTDGRMSAHFDSSTICIYENNFNHLLNSPYVKNDENAIKTITRFIVAHEVSHFIQELDIRSSKDKRSITYASSVFSNTRSEMYLTMFGRDIKTQEQLDSLSKDELITYRRINDVLQSDVLRGHIEVDYYAYLIFMQLGYKLNLGNISNYLSYLHSFSSNLHTDSKLRQKIITGIGRCKRYVERLNLYESLDVCLTKRSIGIHHEMLSDTVSDFMKNGH